LVGATQENLKPPEKKDLLVDDPKFSNKAIATLGIINRVLWRVQIDREDRYLDVG